MNSTNLLEIITKILNFAKLTQWDYTTDEPTTYMASDMQNIKKLFIMTSAAMNYTIDNLAP